MADEDDEEFGFEDDLDDLPASTLAELERNALLSTQRVRSASTRHNASQLPQRAPVPVVQRAPQTFDHPGPARTHSYGREDIIDLTAQPLAVQGQYVPPNRGPVLQNRREQQNYNVPGNHGEQPDGSAVVVKSELDDHEARIQQLEAALQDAQKKADEATRTAQSKAGEAAILRKRLETIPQVHEREMAVQKQRHLSEVEKLKAALETAKADAERVATDNQFLEHDFARDKGKVRQKSFPAEKGGGSPAVTPRKSRVQPFRDGFDDDMIMLSPSRAKEKSRMLTPKGKRKRGKDESPQKALPLRLSQPDQSAPPQVETPVGDIVGKELLHELSEKRDTLSFLQRLLNHSLPNGRVFEVLAKLTVPWSDYPLSTSVYDGFLRDVYSDDQVDRSMQTRFCKVLIEQWKKCLNFPCHEPIKVIIGILQYVIDSEPFAFARSLIEDVVPLAIATADIVAIPVARASLEDKTPIPPADDLSKNIDVLQCLDVLHGVAQSASRSPEAEILFWIHMKFDFILLMLMKAQPISQIMAMLKLLHLSILGTSFGAVIGPDDDGPDRQSRRETDTIDRLTQLLFERPAPPPLDPKDPSPVVTMESALLSMRLAVVHLLAALCVPEDGGRALASHRYALGRLFRFLHEVVGALYSFAPGFHDVRIASVNTAMRVVHHVIVRYLSVDEVRARLATVQGGMHMHVMTLTRVAFAERVAAEEGLQEGVMDAAHHLLDEYLSPDEGEQLLKMFPSAVMEE
ncbi:hypothetical protein EJ06DRAFT_357215 [Trichodelitschia bisporula]|uniref:DNA repair protein Rad26 n=1 Tax=Trichodelitschia bisporula TaxID=703511 RepID=A0A6G1I0Y1_9PEZI|nr:hypothetical protein EJ06DRAFT_357215 [Trichodelitschia bisporula]